MINKKDKIYHFLGNVLTIVNFELDELKMPAESKNRLLDLLDASGVLINFEEVFCGKKPLFFTRSFSLTDVLEELSFYLDSRLKRDFTFESGDLELVLDKQYFFEGLKRVLIYLVTESDEVKVFLDGGKLMINFGSSVDIGLKNEIVEYLSTQDFSIEKFGFAFGLKLLEALSLEFSLEKGVLEIDLT